MPVAVNAFTLAQQQFAPRARRWATPGAMAQHFEPTTRQTDALEAIDAHLVQLTDGQLPVGHGNRLDVEMPPQEGKSQRCSRWYPAWLLANDPTLRIALMSYSADLAVRWGRNVRRLVNDEPDIGVTLRKDTRRANEWETVQGGGMITVGRDGGLTGRPVDVLIIDDPFSSQSDALSPTVREHVWSWWESVAVARLSPRGRVLLMNTRWHEDDLSGRFQTREAGRWTILRIPAIADSPDDPLGRLPGTEMVSAQGRAPGYFHDLKATRSPFVFAAVWQQRPTPAEGGLFRSDGWRYWRTGVGMSGRQVIVADGMVEWPLEDCLRFLTVDLASSVRTSADFTVAAVWAVTPDGQLLLCDQVRRRMPIGEHWGVVRSLREKWDAGTVYVESRMFGTTLVYEAGRAGIPIEELDADTDKVTRAIPAADRQHAGTLWLPQGAPWLHDWLTEVTTFPNAAHDDQVDALAYAARVAAANWLRPIPPENTPPREWADPLTLADDALALPNLDLMHLNY